MACLKFHNTKAVKRKLRIQKHLCSMVPIILKEIYIYTHTNTHTYMYYRRKNEKNKPKY